MMPSRPSLRRAARRPPPLAAPVLCAVPSPAVVAFPLASSKCACEPPRACQRHGHGLASSQIPPSSASRAPGTRLRAGHGAGPPEVLPDEGDEGRAGAREPCAAPLLAPLWFLRHFSFGGPPPAFVGCQDTQRTRLLPFSLLERRFNSVRRGVVAEGVWRSTCAQARTCG